MGWEERYRKAKGGGLSETRPREVMGQGEFMGSVQGTSPHPGIAHLGVGGSCSRRRPPQSSGHGMLRAGSRDRCFPAGSLSLTVASSAEFWAPRRDKGVWCRLCPRGRTQSRHLRRSRSGLLLWPLWVRAGASALRLLVPPTLGKAAALARLLPSCLCNPADAPHSPSHLPLRALYASAPALAAQARQGTAVQGPRLRHRTALHQCGTEAPPFPFFRK